MTPRDIDPDGGVYAPSWIFDGDQAWVTPKAIPVITNGVQSDLAITLDLSPGRRQGRGYRQRDRRRNHVPARMPAPSRSSSTSTPASRSAATSPPGQASRAVRHPVRHQRPPGRRHLCRPGRTDERFDQTWANAAGVPVITNGNPLSRSPGGRRRGGTADTDSDAISGSDARTVAPRTRVRLVALDGVSSPGCR